MATVHLAEALGRALALPRGPHEQPINAAQLRLAFVIAHVETGLDRFTIAERERHERPTVDKRLEYLRAKGLVTLAPKARYHDTAAHRATAHGRALYDAWRRRRSHRALLAALDAVLALPAGRREAPVNAGHLAVLATVAREPEGIGTDALLTHVGGAKPTLVSRLRFLEERGLIERLPRFNAGGNGHPNRYRLTDHGRALVTALAGSGESTRAAAHRCHSSDAPPSGSSRSSAAERAFTGVGSRRW